MKKVAIVGGAFNCIHKGHIELAEYLLDYYDYVRLMPCANHVYNKEMESSRDRYLMCKAAVRNKKRIIVSDFDMKNNPGGETYLMVRKLLDSYRARKQYKFSIAIGIDNANTFDKWVRSQDLMSMIPFVVVLRTGEKRKKKVDWYLKPPHCYLEPKKPLIEMSSTKIREALKWMWLGDKGQKHENILQKGLDSNVIDYIIRHKLYQPKFTKSILG